MKNQPLIILFFALLLASCASELSPENIVGTWQVTDFTSNADLAPSIIEGGKEVAITSTYKFAADGTIQYDDAFVDQPQNSVWELDAEKKKITFTAGNDQKIFQIKSFTKNEMIWLESMGDMGTNEYILVKVN
jgi:hypothetical protein